MADLTIKRGDDFRAVVTLTQNSQPFDLTGYTAAAQIRPNTASNASLTAEFIATIESPETDGVVTLELAHDVTSTLTINGVWDMEITDGDGWVTTVVGGAIIVSPDVTRAEP